MLQRPECSVRSHSLCAAKPASVSKLGSGSRGFGAVRERVPGGKSNVSKGVKAEVGEKQAALDIELVVEYGVPIAALASAVRGNVISSVERMTGLVATFAGPERV